MCPKCICGRGSAAVGAYSAPAEPLAVFEGATSRMEGKRGRRDRKGKRGGMEWKRRE